MPLNAWEHKLNSENDIPVKDTFTGEPVRKTNESQAPNISWHQGLVPSTERQNLLQQKPATIWLTGLSGSGKSTIAHALEKELLEQGRCCYVLDGDNLRHHLNRDLGFSASDRRENIRRSAEVARLMNDAGLIVITALISPYRADREMAREIVDPERFIEVYVSTPTKICEERDPKGLYKKARKGEIPEFTGISSPYEAPHSAALEINTELISVKAATARLRQHLIDHRFIR
jgi:adenylyl-sulfate kinase